MGRILTLVILITIGGVTLNAQNVWVEHNTPQHSTEQIENVQKVPTKMKINRYTCQRCGSENQLDWAPAGSDEKSHQTLIPHCGVCGKKYWPKFKPSSIIQRTYCINKSPEGLIDS